MPTQFQGWVPPEERTREVAQMHARLMAKSKVFGAEAHTIAGSGRGKVVLLHNAIRKLNNGRFDPNLQTIGDCVSHGWGVGIEVLSAVQVLKNGGKWSGKIATEWIYGTSRVLQGGGRLRNNDGSLGSWAAAAVEENGVLFRKRYDKVDLSRYDGKVAKSWGYRGLPTEMEVIADEHPVGATAQVTSYEEARDSIANGYPVPVCSNQGFADRRDEKGFARAKGKWAHCMVFIAVDDADGRPGLLCLNSWGPDWIGGPKRHEQPEGSFWVDADTADRMLRGGDSFAISNFHGFKQQDGLDARLW